MMNIDGSSTLQRSSGQCIEAIALDGRQGSFETTKTSSPLQQN
jgi:hypothetical protein